MNIHEYQAKELFNAYGIPVPQGAVATSPEEFPAALEKLPQGTIVVKSQIHAGGRGKGTFTDGFKGGIKLVDSREEASDIARKMLGNTLVTEQTGPEGRLVQTVYFTAANDIEKEYYLAIVMDRESASPIVIASTEGGVDIETVAAETPERIINTVIDPTIGLQAYQARKIAFGLGFEGEQVRQFTRLLGNLYRLFWEKDASQMEINPLITTPEGDLVALDAKASFDENALFRQKDVVAFRDLNEEDPKEVEASKYDLNYIALDGNIACMVNGAGLAMATMDIIKHFGGSPANFLDVGGGAEADQVTQAFKIILSDTNVKGILVNIFGGIMKCDTIANGIIEAAKAVDLDRPLVVRLEGTNVEAGKKLLNESGLDIVPADNLAEAAKKIVELVGKA